MSFPLEGGGVNKDLGMALTVLNDGSTIATGRFQNSITLGTASLVSAGGDDIFISKLDQNGNVEWSTSAGGASNDQVRSITSFEDGSSIITGNFYGTAIFGNTALQTSGGINNADIFIAKLNANGNFEWAKQAGGGDFDIGYGITSHGDGSSTVVGYFERGATFGDITLTAEGGTYNEEIFVAKLDANGEYLWVRQAGSSQNDIGYGITSFANDDSTLITGFFRSTAKFGQHEVTANNDNNNNKEDIFIAKIQSDGEFLWVRKAGGARGDYGYSAAPLNDGSALVTGFFYDDAQFGDISISATNTTNINDRDVFVAKLNPQGAYEWVTAFGGDARDSGKSIISLNDGSSIVTGYMRGSGDFGSTQLVSEGSDDAFIAKLNPNGSFEWAKQFGGTGDDAGLSLANLDDKNFLITGYFSGTVDLSGTSLISTGDNDIYIAALDESGNWLSSLDIDSTDVNIIPSIVGRGGLKGRSRLRGRSRLKGTDEADLFAFHEFDSFKRKNADLIVNFNPSQGDKISVSEEAFPSLAGADEISFASARTVKERRRFSRQDIDLVYCERTGRLLANGNGQGRRWGNRNEGGLMAVLQGAPELTADDVTLLGGMPGLIIDDSPELA